MARSILALGFALVAGTAAAQPAATLSGIEGSVLVNQGKQFVSAESGQLLVVGDRVMVMEGSGAKLSFSNGCVQTLPAGSLAVVQATCSDKSITRLSALKAQAVGDNRDCDDDGIIDSQDDDVDCRNNALIWVAGGVAAGAIIYAISDGDDETISP